MTELREMFTNSEHTAFIQETWANEKYYVRQGDTIYKLHNFYGQSARVWLNGQSPLFKDNEYRVYIPVATLETKGDNETFIGYIWEKANMSNHLLVDYRCHGVKSRYPNLYWCDVGNHPYPKDVRAETNWREGQFNKYAQRLVYPNYDITKAVLFPSLLNEIVTPP